MRGHLWAGVDDLSVDIRHDALTPSALEYASFVLWALSGRLYTPLTTTTEAYDTRHTLASGAGDVYPVFLNGAPYNLTTCSACQCSGCGVLHRTRLRNSPVRHILDVWADGERIPWQDIVLLDHSVLGLRDPCVCNATCLVVRYTYGTGIPPGGHLAAAKLAEELIRAARGEDCSLPQRVTSVSRQGMSWTVLDPQEFMSQGRTGIYEVDLLLAALNPARALARARVFSPDLPRAETHTIGPPPMSLALGPGDQAVLPGLPARFVITDPHILAALRADPSGVSAVGGDPSRPIPGRWALDPSGTSATLSIDADITRHMPDGSTYTLRTSGGAESCGTIRTFR